MARLAARRTRSPELEDEEDAESRAGTPLSTAPNDRKRARRTTYGSESPPDSEHDAPTQRHSLDNKQAVSSLVSATDAHHQPGAIVRVKLINFVTYTKAEFFPGPSLNMVIGPNGTGKSTLVCAICLGLGWGPAYLGRAKDLGDFVKHGAREATIEIELKRAAPGNKQGLPSRRNLIITRTIQRDGNKSAFTFNGEASAAGAVRRQASAFNIQIDNLCQFLPQDRVVEFAQMKPHEVLVSTQQAAGTPRMVKCYENLQAIRLRQKEVMGGQRTDLDELDSLKRRHEAQRVEVNREKEYRGHKQRLEHLRKVKVIPEFNTAKIMAAEAKTSQKRLARELRILQEEVEPTLRKVNAKQVYKNRLTNVKREWDDQVKVAAARCDNIQGEIAELETRISDYNSQIDTDKEQVKTKQNDLRKHQTLVTRLKHQHGQPPPEFDARVINEEIADRNREANDIEGDLRNARDRRTDLLAQAETRKHAIAEKEQQLRAFDTHVGQRENVLHTLSKDTAKAWRWIQENKVLFEKPVFGPPAIECTVPDKNMVKAVEAGMQDSDYRIITAQTAHDYKLLQQKLTRDLGLHQISLRMRLEDDLDRYQKPYSTEELRQYGLDAFVIDYIQGPRVVLAVLCSERMLHQSAIATGAVSSDQHDRLMHSKISSYYCDGQSHRFRRRPELGPDVVMSTSNLARPPRVWIDKPVDLGRKANLQRELAEARGEMQEVEKETKLCNEEIQQEREKIQELKGEIDKIKKDKSEKQNQLTAWNALPQKIADQERKAADVQNWLSTARDRREDWEQKKQESLVDRAEVAIRYADSVRALKEAMTAAIAAEVMLIEATSDFEVLEQRNRNIKTALDEKKAEEKAAAETAKSAGNKSRRLFQAAEEIAKEATDEDEQSRPELLNLVKDILSKKWTPADWEAEIESVNANIALTEGGTGDAIRQYEEREKKIAVLEERLSGLSEEVDNLRGAIQELRDEWEPPLDALVARISDAFSDSFARIGCAGQVEVFKASSTSPEDCTDANGGEDNGLDFANWAINISVKFRENEPLSLLDSHRQSGGERAVSTIFYLMALQSLSRAPFRVVDEINQGMDGRNERMVHGRMVDVATATRDDGGQGSQYFLITPKLLSGLKYTRGMTVLCIVSGESVPGEGNATTEEDRARVGWRTYPRLDFSKLAATARSHNLARFAGRAARIGQRVDSGVVLVRA